MLNDFFLDPRLAFPYAGPEKVWMEIALFLLFYHIFYLHANPQKQIPDDLSPHGYVEPKVSTTQSVDL